MTKRVSSLLFALAMVGAALAVAPAHAQPPPEIPADPNVKDPVGDGNYLNDQGLGGFQGAVPEDGDHTTPADVSSSADIVAGWLTNDEASVTAHIQVEGGLPATPPYFFRFRVDPAGGTEPCLWFQAAVPAMAEGTDPSGSVRNICGDGTTEEGKASLAAGPEGSTIVSVTVPMGTFGLAPGMTLGSPTIHSRNHVAVATAPQVDNTKPGRAYTITSGDEASAGDDPPGKDATPGKRKGCAKKARGKGCKKNSAPAKGKAKKKNKNKRSAAACDAYVPGDADKEAATLVVTDEATEQKPLEWKATFDMSAANFIPVQDPSTQIVNLQVDSASEVAGLYVSFEFEDRRDYDLLLQYPSGNLGAESTAWNTVHEGEGAVSSTGHGGESSAHSEMLVGIETADCGGWTLVAENWFGEGGEYPINIWLAEPKTEPQPDKES